MSNLLLSGESSGPAPLESQKKRLNSLLHIGLHSHVGNNFTISNPIPEKALPTPIMTDNLPVGTIKHPEALAIPTSSSLVTTHAFSIPQPMRLHDLAPVISLPHPQTVIAEASLPASRYKFPKVHWQEEDEQAERVGRCMQQTLTHTPKNSLQESINTVSAHSLGINTASSMGLGENLSEKESLSPKSKKEITLNTEEDESDHYLASQMGISFSPSHSSLVLGEHKTPTSTNLHRESTVVALSPSRPPSPVMDRTISKKKKKADKSPKGKGSSNDDFVTEKFVEECNKHFGKDRSHLERANRLITSMRELGGLEGSSHEVDIGAARNGLCILAQLTDHHCKVRALDSLLEMLNKDDLKKKSAIGLVSLAKRFMNQITPSHMQTEIVDVQIKIAMVYAALASLLQRHYAKEHINAIEKKLKIELTNTASALAALNTHNNRTLTFYVRSALQGIIRLKDDRFELFLLLDRIAHAALAVGSIFRQDEVTTFYDELHKAFADLPTKKGEWYTNVFILQELKKELLFNKRLSAKAANQLLAKIQILIRDKYKKMNWEFAYAAVDTLFEICLYSATAELRERAFKGVRQLGTDYPGLASMATCNDIPFYRDYKAIKHLKKAKKINPNLFIRKISVQNLIFLVKNSKDPNIIQKARRALTQRKGAEKHEPIQKLIAEFEVGSPKSIVRTIEAKSPLTIETKLL